MLFAGAKAAIGNDSVDIEIALPVSIEAIKRIIVEQHPKLEPIVRYSRMAIGCEFVDDQFIVLEENLKHDFALIPPVSGG